MTHHISVAFDMPAELMIAARLVIPGLSDHEIGRIAIAEFVLQDALERHRQSVA